jgi:hypothetical protein
MRNTPTTDAEVGCDVDVIPDDISGLTIGSHHFFFATGSGSDTNVVRSGSMLPSQSKNNLRVPESQGLWGRRSNNETYNDVHTHATCIH